MAVKDKKPAPRASDKKPGFGARLKRFFTNLRSETKKVVWPDRKRLIQSTATVLMIILSAALIIWVFDNVINVVLSSLGFYTPATPAPTTLPSVTEVTEAPQPLPSVEG